MLTEDGQGIFSFIEGTYFGEVEIFDNVLRLCFVEIIVQKKMLLSSLSANSVANLSKEIFHDPPRRFPRTV